MKRCNRSSRKRSSSRFGLPSRTLSYCDAVDVGSQEGPARQAGPTHAQAGVRLRVRLLVAHPIARASEALFSALNARLWLRIPAVLAPGPCGTRVALSAAASQ